MKKNMMLVVLVMLTSTIIFAQRLKGDPAAMAEKRAERMKKALALNDDQYARIKVLNRDFAASLVKLRADTALTVGTMHNRMKSLRTEQETQLKTVLTAEQWKKWSDLKAKRMEKWKQHGRKKEK